MRLYRLQLFFIFLTIGFFQKPLLGQLATPLINGHAHNDYAKQRAPLLKALELGFTSVEVDVFSHRGKLKVAHVPLFLNLRKDLEEMYFKPLDQFLRASGGHCFADTTVQLVLMIDIKRNAAESYRLLRQICKQYPQWITHRLVRQDSLIQRPVKVIMSGAKPYNELLQDSVQFMFMDGGFGVLQNTDLNAVLVPRVSTSFRSFFKWRGRGPIPKDELMNLREIVQAAHKKGHKVRFWAMPNKKKVWTVLLREGVDWMNVDKLTRFRTFYLELEQ